MRKMKSKKVRRKVKRTFLKKGTCSRTFFYILNREFGHPMEDEEQAVDLLAGGIQQQGYQCGMLWGASCAAGAESFRRCKDDCHRAIGMSIKATQHILESFVNRTNTANCSDITEIEWANKWSIAKYMFSGKFWNCFKLAEKWAPDAIQSVTEGLNPDQTDLPEKPVSCASEVIRKMGGTDMEMVIVSGFAGGIGLSGNGCGALGAAVWMNTLRRIREQSYKVSFPDPVAEKILNRFYEASDYEMECNKITGKHFASIKDHTDFINNGGCDKLIDILAQS